MNRFMVSISIGLMLALTSAAWAAPPKCVTVHVEETPTVADADDVFYVPASGRVYVSGSGGAVAVYDRTDAGAYRSSQRIATSAEARTSLLDPATRTLYVAVPEQNDQPARLELYQLITSSAASPSSNRQP